MAEISVIVPVYNVEMYLYRCVQSIIEQKFKDYEIILIDDGSPDNSPMICDDILNSFSNEQIIIIHKRNGGLSDARNTGIEYALNCSDSKWITFVDSDDWLDAHYLRVLYGSAVNDGVKCSICGFKVTNNDFVLNSDIDKYVSVCDIPENQYKNLLDQKFKHISFVRAYGKLFEKQLFDNVRFPYGKINEDRFTTHKLIFKCDTISIVDCPLYIYYQSNNSIMRSKWTPKRLDDIEAFDLQFEYFSRNNASNAMAVTIREYVKILCAQLREIKDCDITDEYRYVRTTLKNRLRRTIVAKNKFAKLDMVHFEEAYVEAFPFLSPFIIIANKVHNVILIIN